LSALRAGRTLFLVLISVRGCANPRAIVRLEGLGQLKKSNDLMVIYKSRSGKPMNELPYLETAHCKVTGKPCSRPWRPIGL
jgi:hypothetical protein